MSLKNIVLVDGSSYLFRAYHALPALTNAQGMPTGAIYGVVNMLRKLQKEYNPDYLGVIFDPKGKTFRHDLYPEYKANRSVMPDDLQCQVQPLFELIKALGFPLLIVDGVEADDVIGTLAHHAREKKMNVVISTGDKDMAQLVGDQVTLINTMNQSTLDREGVREKFGVSPEQMVDYLALMGDSIDNVPGVPQVGPKTAATWLGTYGSLDNLIAHADEISGKAGANFRAALTTLPLSRELVTIRCDVPLPIVLEDLTPRPAEREKALALLEQFEFKSWVSDYASPLVENADPKLKYETIMEESDLIAWTKRLKNSELISFDTETTSLDERDARVVGVSFAIVPDEAAYVPFAHDYMGAPTQLSEATVWKHLKPLLEDDQLKKVGQNLKYDLSVLLNHDIHLRGIAYDTMLESYVLNSTAARHDMDSLALKYLNKQTIRFEDIAGKGAGQLTFNEIPLEQAGPYAAEDADVTLQLHQHLWPKLSAEKGLLFTFEHIELPLIPVLSQMERTGVLIDRDLLAIQSKSLGDALAILEQQAYQLAGEMFNLSSPKQLQVILFEKLGLPIIEKTPTGQASTAESVLSELAEQYELPAVLIKHRSLSKLKSTYTDKLPAQIHPKTGRVHTSYNQTGAGTGRLSSSNPNLQNIPIRSEEGRRIRQAFIAPPGYKIAAFDYSQIELRIMAHLSEDTSLQKAFAQGADIHRATAAEVFGVALDQVNADQRRHAKAINFGLIYGMSAFGLAKQLGVDRKEAQLYVDLYFERYPGVKRYMEETRAKAREQGFVETVYGRRLYLPEINSRNKQRQMGAERAAINGPMQGTAADLIKLAMIRVDQWLEQSKADAKLIMQVHDELVFEVAQDRLDSILPHLSAAMIEVSQLHVPMVVDVGVGDNWDEAH